MAIEGDQIFGEFKPLRPLKKSHVVVNRPRPSLIGGDISDNPFQHRDNELEERGVGDQIGYLIPAQNMLSREQLYAAALTPKGRFITWIAILNTYRNGWRFVQDIDTKSPLPKRLQKKLVTLTKQYDLKEIFSLARSFCGIWGQALVWRLQRSKRGEKLDYDLIVSPIWTEHIVYEEDHRTVKMYRPRSTFGNQILLEFEIEPKDAVLWVNHKDPFGSPEQGVPDLIAAYRTIQRSEAVAEKYAELIVQRGLGQLDIEIDGVYTQADIEAWADTFRKLLSDSVVVHSPDMKTNVTPGIHSGYDYPQTQNSYYEDTASATGYPQMRMRGVQTGTVTGSETDQDNIAEIYSGNQEFTEKYMFRTYEMLDPSLKDAEFDFDWERDFKMDPQRVANKFATDISSIMTGAEIMTMDQAFAKLGLPTLGPPVGEMLVQEFIDKKFGQEPENQEPPPQPSGRLPEGEQPQQAETPEEEPEEDEIDAMEEIGDLIEKTVKKDDLARIMLEAGVSTRKVNSVLRNDDLFKKGCSYSTLQKLK
jgi:hypothetical protein